MTDAQAVVAILVGLAAIATSLLAYHRWFGNRAVRESDLAEVAEWFRGPTQDHPLRESLPMLVMQQGRKLDRYRDEVSSYAESDNDMHLLAEKRFDQVEARLGQAEQDRLEFRRAMTTMASSVSGLVRRLEESLSTQEEQGRVLESLSDRLDQRLTDHRDEVDTKVDGINGRVDHVESRLDAMEHKLDELLARTE